MNEAFNPNIAARGPSRRHDCRTTSGGPVVPVAKETVAERDQAQKAVNSDEEEKIEC